MKCSLPRRKNNYKRKKAAAACSNKKKSDVGVKSGDGYRQALLPAPGKQVSANHKMLALHVVSVGGENKEEAGFAQTL